MDRRIQIAISLMKQDLHQEPQLDSIAKTLNISCSRLRYLFKSETGMPPAQYFKNLKMERAKELAGTTFLNVKQIMYELGFNDESHFVRDFKKTYGLTITQFREVCGDGYDKGEGMGHAQSNEPINNQIG